MNVYMLSMQPSVKAMCFNVTPTPSCQTLHSHAYICIDLHIIVLELSEAMQEPQPTLGSIEAHFFQGFLILHNSGARSREWVMSHLDWLPLVHVSSWIIPNSSTPLHLRSGLQVHHCGWRVPFHVCSCTSPWAGKSGGGIGIFKFLQLHVERVRIKKTRWSLSACCLIKT